MPKFLLEERCILKEASADPRDILVEPEVPAARSASGSIDWEEAYQNCKTSEDFNKFWNGDGSGNPGYYRAVWGENSARVKSFGAAFIDALEDFGWTAEVNPLIAFLELIIEAKGGLKVSTITPPGFQALANGLTSGYITEEEFTTGGIYDIYNLIFNPSFYTRPFSELKELLQIQHKLKKILPCTNKGYGWANIYSKVGNLENLDLFIQPGRDLRKLSEIKAIIRKLSTDDELEAEDAHEVVERITSASDAAKVLSYLFDVYLMTSPKAAALANNKSRGYIQTLRDKTSTKAGELSGLISKYGLRSVPKDSEEAQDILLSLARKSGWSD